MEGSTGSPSKERLKILMVTPRYLPEMGGVENHVYQVASRLADAGVQITVLTTDRSGKLPKDELINGVNIHRVLAFPAHRDYYYAPGIYQFISQTKADLVHVQSYHTLVAPLAMLAASRGRLPYILTFHGGGHSSRLRNASRSIQLALLRPMLAKAERLVIVARFEKTFYSHQLRLPEDRFVLIPNGADLPSHKDNHPSHDGILIASVGRLERYKGHQRIIAALPAILKQIPDVKLWIAGKGLYEPALRKLVKELGVEDHVRIEAVPPDDRDRMARELECSSLVVLLSEYETHPIAVLEAIALGRPALVTNTSGLSELCDQGLAKGIPLNSTTEQVAAAVIEQLHNPLLPARVNLPTWDDCARDLLTLYEQVAMRQI